MLKNPFAFRVHYRDGIPVLPGAFPIIGQAPSLYLDAAEVMLRGRERLGNLFWMDVGFGQHIVMCA
ncbi:MAG TPA: hypothetical protein VK459_05980, partial [Polyangiaceae bacterium]|nr:hypothetical protein [Polyangiaceae bacterium]